MQVPVSMSVLPTTVQIDPEFRPYFHPTSISAVFFSGKLILVYIQTNKKETYSWFSPKQQKLLRSCHVIIWTCRFEQDKRHTHDTCAHRFQLSISPSIIAHETGVTKHINQMLLGNIVLACNVLLQWIKDPIMLLEMATACNFKGCHVGGLGV